MTTNTDTTDERLQNQIEVHETTRGERELSPFMTGVISVELRRSVEEHGQNIKKRRTGDWANRDSAERLAREMSMAKALTYHELNGVELPD